MGFLPGAQLSASFYTEVVADLVGVPHAAALTGGGSEVLGFDTERSTDHSWGPRLQVFVAADAVEPVRAALEDGLPRAFGGWPVSFYRLRAERVEHDVEVATVEGWLDEHLGFDPRSGMTTARWLGCPQQLLLEATAGPVFHDGVGDLTEVRQRLAWYPDDVWCWLLSCQWHRVQELEPLVGRTAEVGDELGSRLVVARQVRQLVRLCFLQERRYAPWDTWLGSALGRFEAGARLGAVLADALAAPGHRGREAALVEAYEKAARRHNDLELTSWVDPDTGPYEVPGTGAVRPYPVLGAGRFVRACRDAIGDEALRRLEPVGSVDQLADPTDLLVHRRAWIRRLTDLYGRALAPEI